ncbi:hypothetical protein BJY00DRAFT_295629 [Aspergillus carlsbadensis]|nr:hypothetical protein BJY00DRAFT_295629 [Aspergillus carlsbadensis]
MADSRIVFITGANTGIGYQIVKALYSADKPYTVIVGSRSLSKAEDAISSLKAAFSTSKNTLVPLTIDIESDESIQTAAEEVETKFGRIDALINNAGAQFDFEITSGTLTPRAAWLKSWNVNVAGTQVLTSTLVPLLLKSSDPRLLFVTSGTSSLSNSAARTIPIDTPPAAGWPKDTRAPSVTSYRTTKTGLNMLVREWDRILKNDGVKVWAVSPGLLATGLVGTPEG